MNYLQTRRLCELKKSIGAPVFGFQWTILTFVVVSILFTVSLIFQTSPRVARGACDSQRWLKFKLVFSRLGVEDGDRRCDLMDISCDVAFFSLCVLKRKEVCVDLHEHGNHNSPSHKSCSSTHTRWQTIRISINFTLISLVVREYPNHFDSGDRNLQLGG